MARKKIQDLVSELRSWLPNYDHGPDSFPTTLYRVLASLPGGDELEDMGYQPMGGIGWHEADLLGRVLEAIQDKGDVEDLVRGLMSEEEEEGVSEMREAKRFRPSSRGRNEPDPSEIAFEVVRTSDGHVESHIHASTIEQARDDLRRGKAAGWYSKDATVRHPQGEMREARPGVGSRTIKLTETEAEMVVSALEVIDPDSDSGHRLKNRVLQKIRSGPVELTRSEAEMIESALDILNPDSDAGHQLKNHILAKVWPNLETREARETGSHTTESHELALYTINDGDIYRQTIQPIIKNLARKIRKGTYDAELAVQAWMYAADAGAKKYTKEFDVPGGPNGSFGAFSKADRMAAAREIGEQYDEELQMAAKAVREEGMSEAAHDNLVPFHSWKDVLEYANSGAPLYYKAPMDTRAVRLSPRKEQGQEAVYEAHARTIRIWPYGSTGRGRSRTADPFTADAGHLDRFLHSTEGSR